jgi:hypothetical protein
VFEFRADFVRERGDVVAAIRNVQEFAEVGDLAGVGFCGDDDLQAEFSGSGRRRRHDAEPLSVLLLLWLRQKTHKRQPPSALTEKFFVKEWSEGSQENHQATKILLICKIPTSDGKPQGAKEE